MALQSCGRFGLTCRTLETWRHYNRHNTPPFPVEYIMAEDGKVSPENRRTGRAFGFTDVSIGKRLGNTGCRKYLIQKARDFGATHVLLWENDWESIRPIPWKLIQFVMEQEHIYHLRLWHEWKIPRKYEAWVAAGKPPYVSRHRGRDNASPEWAPLIGAPEPAEVGSIHWSAPPAVTRIQEAIWLHKDVRAESGSILKSGEIDHLVARVTNNVIWHIGEAQRTPEFKR